jgi:hypothetical protein
MSQIVPGHKLKTMADWNKQEESRLAYMHHHRRRQAAARILRWWSKKLGK